MKPVLAEKDPTEQQTSAPVWTMQVQLLAVELSIRILKLSWLVAA